MKIRYYIYIIVAVLLTACSDEQEQWTLSPAQQELIGKGVNFNASIADPFVTRVSYRHDGSFNENDEMTIYRQYSTDGGHSFDPNTEAYRVYRLVSKTATGTDIVLETDWKPIPDRTGYNPNTTDYPEGKRGAFVQTIADSLTWDNGQTVRFRAWSRSNMSNLIERSKANKDYYYPDYCIADWATVSGPTMSVPLTLKHQGCRIGFTQKAGNELYKAEICTEAADYMWNDNADNLENDDNDKWSDAADKAAAVLAVYNQMCMPAGIDIETGVLTTMTSAKYEAMAASKFGDLTTSEWADGIVKINTKTPEEIASNVQRPTFGSNVDGRLYMITIPYDMSNDDKSGESLKLPSYTRFRIWLYDVNNGDKANTTGTEANYHILSLSDIKKGEDPLFPDGLELVPGRSYVFSVGYHYDHFDVTPTDDFSWKDETISDGVATSQTQTVPTAGAYQWWKDAIKKAIPKSIQDSYNPQFHISTEQEFIEFINLVNGTAHDPDLLALTLIVDPAKTFGNNVKPGEGDYRWYSSDKVQDGKLKPEANVADSVTHSQAETDGYIFFQHYYPADGDQAAYTREDYLRAPYSFYDENLNRHFTVWLDADLDLKDYVLPSIGVNSDKPFRGVFDGYDETHSKIHQITNINMDGGYMFKYCVEAAVKNLYIETVHNFMLVDQAKSPDDNPTGYGAYIVGISLKAPSSGNPIAGTLLGSSYVVGCIYQGHAGGAMVGTANNLNMYANMMAASGLTSGSGALLGSYSGSSEFFAPQTGQKLSWGRFHANYFDVTLSPGTIAVGEHAGYNYKPQQYIRGRESWILKAKNDNLILDDEIDFEKDLTPQMRLGYYGLAPWKAMNYALYEYNKVGAEVSESHNCKSHFVNDKEGYFYPYHKYGEPNSANDATGYKDNYPSLNILEQNN